MTIPKYTKLVFALALGAAVGCASANKKLDDKLSKEVEVNSRAGLNTEAGALIQKSNSLSASQKERLLALRENVRKEMDQMQKESIKLRALLIQDVLAPQYNQQEVDLIKSRISKLEHKRTQAMFDAVDHANEILGRENSQDEKNWILFDMMSAPDRQRGEF